MIRWADFRLYEEPETKKIIEDIEACGSDILAKASGHDLPWVKHMRLWEYPFIVNYVNQLKELLGKDKLKIMEFGCGTTPLAEYFGRQGHEVLGVEKFFDGYVNPVTKEEWEEEYPNAKIYIGDVIKLEERDFDVIVSASVLEHIDSYLLKTILFNMNKMLATDGKHCHVMDYYFHLPRRNKQMKELCEIANIEINDSRLIPGSEDFDFDFANSNLNRLIVAPTDRGYFNQLDQTRVGLTSDLEKPKEEIIEDETTLAIL